MFSEKGIGLSRGDALFKNGKKGEENEGKEEVLWLGKRAKVGWGMKVNSFAFFIFPLFLFSFWICSLISPSFPKIALGSAILSSSLDRNY